MKIIVNGEPRQVADSLKLAELVETMGVTNKRIAVEINDSIIPRSTYTVHLLKVGDKVEVVHAIGGG